MFVRKNGCKFVLVVFSLCDRSAFMLTRIHFFSDVGGLMDFTSKGGQGLSLEICHELSAPNT